MQTANCIGSVNSAYTVSDPKEQENAKNLSSRSLEKHFKNASSASIVWIEASESNQYVKNGNSGVKMSSKIIIKAVIGKALTYISISSRWWR